MTKIQQLAADYDNFVYKHLDVLDTDEGIYAVVEETNNVVDKIRKMKISNLVTINRLIETSLDICINAQGKRRSADATKHTKKLLNLLYKADKDRFLSNFVAIDSNFENNVIRNV